MNQSGKGYEAISKAAAIPPVISEINVMENSIKTPEL